jgi:dirigent-like protein
VHARKVIAAIGAIAAVAVSAAQGAGRPEQTGPAQIRITDVQMSYSLVRSRRGNHGAGSVELVKQRLYNPSISSKPIGRATLMCTYFDAHDRACSGTYFLPKGSLVVVGAIQSRLLYQIAVVGGTGLFDNARGTLTVTSTGLRPTRREVLLFRLAG